MRIAIPAAHIWARARRHWRVWHARPRHASVALVILLTLAIGEPLLCILHCQVWLPFARNSYLTAQTHHHHHAPTLAASPGEPGVAITQACFVRYGSGSDQPFHIPPSPVHEMVPVPALLLIVLLLIGVRQWASPIRPPHISSPPPLRPPQPSQTTRIDVFVPGYTH